MFTTVSNNTTFLRSESNFYLRSLPPINPTFEFKKQNGFRFPPDIEKAGSSNVKQVVKIEVAEFGFELKLKINKVEPFQTEIVYHLEFYTSILKLSFYGIEEDNRFRVKAYSFDLEKNDNTPELVFRFESLLSICGLGKKLVIQLPNNKCELSNSSKLELAKISNFLQGRQLAYRLMVIEKALRVHISFPKGPIAGKDIESIGYCYHSILDRKFEWECNTDAEVGFTGTGNETKEIFGKTINLGIQKFTLISYKIAKIESITTPSLPKNAFRNDIQKLIDLDAKLDSMVMDKYFDLAGATLDGLTEEQIKAITERPRLDEEAFNF
jgi:hypothetical protein